MTARSSARDGRDGLAPFLVVAMDPAATA